MGNNLRKEFKGMDVKISEFLNAKKEAVAEIEKLIEYEERSIKENEEYIAEQKQNSDEMRNDWRIEEFNRLITESKMKIIFLKEAIDSILNY